MRILSLAIMAAVIAITVAGCGGTEKEIDPVVREDTRGLTDHAGILLEKARAMAAAGDFDRALELYEELVDDYPDSYLAPEALFWIGSRMEETGNYADAINRYEDLVDEYPDSDFSPEALFRIGNCLEEEDELLEAFQTYQILLNDYPGKGSLGEILEREFKIGEAFMNGRKRLFLFFRIRSGLGTAEEIFRAIVNKATFSKVSPRAQYSLGRVLQMEGDYEGAINEYRQVLTNYPGTDVIPLALFNMGNCYYEEALSSDYDPREVDRALRHLIKFVRRFPDDPNKTEAEEKVSELIDRKAEKAYDIAEFYDSADSSAGVKIYYREIIDKYPDSRYADRARKRLEELAEKESNQ